MSTVKKSMGLALAGLFILMFGMFKTASAATSANISVTVTVDIVSITVASNTWAVGAIAPNTVKLSSAIAVTNGGNRQEDYSLNLAYAGVWVALGVFGPAVIAVIAALPAPLVTALVALALLGPLTGALSGAFAAAPQRFAAAVTLTVTASGVAFFGIGAAFWGLAAGLAVFGLEKAAKRLRTS